MLQLLRGWSWGWRCVESTQAALYIPKDHWYIDLKIVYHAPAKRFTRYFSHTCGWTYVSRWAGKKGTWGLRIFFGCDIRAMWHTCTVVMTPRHVKRWFPRLWMCLTRNAASIHLPRLTFICNTVTLVVSMLHAYLKNLTFVMWPSDSVHYPPTLIQFRDFTKSARPADPLLRRTAFNRKMPSSLRILQITYYTLLLINDFHLSQRPWSWRDFWRHRRRSASWVLQIHLSI